MSAIELFLIALGLSMDAFAVSLCKGLAITKFQPKSALTCGLWFGCFQGLMPLLGYMIGSRFQQQIASVDHWIAFVLLALIGLNMIKEAFSEGADEADDDLSCRTMFILALATSIDALTLGMTFAFLKVNILSAATMIAVTTAVVSVIGVRLGHGFGIRFKTKAEIGGGLILILIGLKILTEHLGFFPF